MLGCYNGFFIAESVTVLSCVLLQFYFTLNTVTVALSLNACTFTDQSETSNMVDESVSVDQGGQVIRVDIPNGDGTFTTLEGEEAQKWYDKAGEEDQQEAAEEASTQSIEDVK